MHAIKTKSLNSNGRSIKTKSRNIQLLNTKRHWKLGKRSHNPFHLRNNRHWNPECRCSSKMPMSRSHGFILSLMMKVFVMTSAATSLFSTISCKHQTWTSPYLPTFFYGGGGRVWARLCWGTLSIALVLDDRDEVRRLDFKAAFGVVLSALPLSLFPSLCLLALEHK